MPVTSGQRSRDDDEFVARIVRTLSGHSSLANVRLVGSRAERRATETSDWDFLIDTDDFPGAEVALPRRVAALSPLGTFWDPFGTYECFIALLSGPRKVDFIFEVAHSPSPPYMPSRDNLATMDVHFWDWTVWLVSKQARGQTALVTSELAKMHDLLTGPLGVDRPVYTIEEAVRTYLRARRRAEERFQSWVDPRLSSEALRFLARAGYSLESHRSVD